MNPSQVFNIIMFLLAIGIIGFIFTYEKPKGDGLISSFDIITMLVLSGRKSK